MESHYLIYSLLYNYNNQNSVLLAEEQAYRLAEQNRKFRNTPTHKYVQLIFDKGARAIQRRKESFQKLVLEKPDIYRQKAKS